MSCRLYDGASPVEKPLWPSAGAPLATLATSRVATHNIDDGTVSDLRTRIAELERQLQAQMREAHAKGVQEGRREAMAESDRAMQQLAKSAAELGRVKSHLRKEAESDLVKLSIAIAQRILRRELTVDPHALSGVAASALEKLQLRDVFQVRVHHSHQQLVAQTLASCGASAISVIADTTLQPGDLLFETGRGIVDASLDSQLREIERGFVDALLR